MRLNILTLFLVVTSIFTVDAKEAEISLGITRLSTRVNEKTKEEGIWLTTIVSVNNTRTKPFWMYGDSLTKPHVKIYTQNPKNNKWEILKQSKNVSKPTFHEVKPNESFSVAVVLPSGYERRLLKIEYRSYYKAQHDSFVVVKTSAFSTRRDPPEQ